MNNAAVTVPLYHQTFDFTCGPASLIMAMRAHRPVARFGRDDEIDIWREANLVEAYASSRQGLALSAYRRGFAVRTQGSATSIELLELLELPLGADGLLVARALHQNLVDRMRRAGITDENRPVTLNDIEIWLSRSWTPIVLVDATLVGQERVPHWIVVTEIGPDHVALNDPLASEPGTRVARHEFESSLGFAGTTCAVVIEGIRPDLP